MNMAKFDTKNTKIILIICPSAILLSIIVVAYAIYCWNDNPDKSFNLIIFTSIILHSMGMVLLFNPDFVTLSRKKEGSMKWEGRLFIMGGFICQGVLIIL